MSDALVGYLRENLTVPKSVYDGTVLFDYDPNNPTHRPAALTSGPPRYTMPATSSMDDIGPYMTVGEFMDGVEMGVYGPDETCFWVYIGMDNNFHERIIGHPHEAQPPRTIAVAYYAQ